MRNTDHVRELKSKLPTAWPSTIKNALLSIEQLCNMQLNTDDPDYYLWFALGSSRDRRDKKNARVLVMLDELAIAKDTYGSKR